MTPVERSALSVERSAFHQNAERFDVGCAGDLIHAYPTAREALAFAEWSATQTGQPHEIFDAQTGLALLIVEPVGVAA